ncbi:MAG: hydantoinase B/oxoprolinase family protein [Deltaproteobacteria bacterium]|nr:hydantoinase B/oxoprolinase family protein [Deltaproteobacteria bacterium]
MAIESRQKQRRAAYFRPQLDQLWIDTGGTFTDALLVGDGAPTRAKVLSSGCLRAVVDAAMAPNRLRLRAQFTPGRWLVGFSLARVGDGAHSARVIDVEDQIITLASAARLAVGDVVELSSGEPAAIVAARMLTDTDATAALPPLQMRVGTTRGTNALLERAGADLVLFVSAGFADVLAIGDQTRPELFARRIQRPAPLTECVVEIDERIAADGSIIVALDMAAVRGQVERLVNSGVRVAAIALLNAYRNPQHELALKALLEAAGFAHVSCSHQLSPTIGLLRRGETAVVNAYLSAVVGQFVSELVSAVGDDRRLLLSTSAGGLSQAASYQPKDSLLSGPAAGVVGAVQAASRIGMHRIISFDMGGTSTDVARYDGALEYQREQRIGSARLATDAMAIETVAAGGGSICSFEHGVLTVGPRSAGASPGPACYGAGGPLTLTDVQLLLGRLPRERFGIPIDPAAAERALAELQQTMRQAGVEVERDALLSGLLVLADEKMADTIRRISLRRGFSTADYCLVAFGGAGGMHACQVAAQLGMHSVLIPADAGLLSAVGVGHAAVERIVTKQLLWPLNGQSELSARLRRTVDLLRAEGRALLVDEGLESNVVTSRAILALRYLGQDSVIEVDYLPGQDPAEAFAERHRELFGFISRDRLVELESVRVVVRALARGHRPTARSEVTEDAAVAGWSRAFFAGSWCEVPCYDRSELRAGQRLLAPAIVYDRYSTTLIEPDWQAHTVGAGDLLLAQSAPSASLVAANVDRAIELELFANRLSSIAEEMGEMLRRTALSVNIKERLDFSCAVLDPAGSLIVNAPHVPVHLGSLGPCVRSVLKEIAIGPGDVVITNHPAFGGSHLPDVTLICGVFDAEQRPLAYLANRAHHAEIGGTRPGSMPPDARSLVEEGVVIAPCYLVQADNARFAELKDLLRGAVYPSRNVEENLADMRAQLAALRYGSKVMEELWRGLGRERFVAHLGGLFERAAREARRALISLDDRTYRASRSLDDGTPLVVCADKRGDQLTLSFAGSGAVHPGNLNATSAVVSSAILYVLRLLVDRPLPLNEGMLDPVTVELPESLLNPPFVADPSRCPAVVGGNVETSQQLVDLLLEALEICAASCGTMNNLLFGNDRFGYYETIGGGSGASRCGAGASAVHCHMTNTRITDAEVLEHRYPVRVRRFAVRRGSGGAGLYRGGDGIERELEFLEPMKLSLLGQRRVAGAPGMAGGQFGVPGAQHLLRADGQRVSLPGSAAADVERGDRLIVATPGGGGWGKLGEPSGWPA